MCSCVELRGETERALQTFTYCFGVIWDQKKSDCGLYICCVSSGDLVKRHFLINISGHRISFFYFLNMLQKSFYVLELKSYV